MQKAQTGNDLEAVARKWVTKLTGVSTSEPFRHSKEKMPGTGQTFDFFTSKDVLIYLDSKKRIRMLYDRRVAFAKASGTAPRQDISLERARSMADVIFERIGAPESAILASTSDKKIVRDANPAGYFGFEYVFKKGNRKMYVLTISMERKFGKPTMIYQYFRN